MHRKTVAFVLLAALALGAFASQNYVPPAESDVRPGIDTVAYDDGIRYYKAKYNQTGKGWGVLFDVACSSCVYVQEIHVNLCPPELDDSYECEIVLYAADGPFVTPGTELGRKDFDVLVGEWWHYIDVSDLGLNVGAPGFFAFCYAKNHPTLIYQWFDQYDDAPYGTQWYFDGTNFSPYSNPNHGDIEIRAVLHAHDVMCNSITAPLGAMYYGQNVTPKAYVMNVVNGAWTEEDVRVRFWITPEEGGTPVYDQMLLVDFPAVAIPFQITFPTALVDWDPGKYVGRCSTMLPCDYDPLNNWRECRPWVEKVDVAALSIEAPVGFLASGINVIPQGTVKNTGTLPATFPVAFTIDDGSDATVYADTQLVTGLAPGAEVQVDFAAYTTGSPGVYSTNLKTMLPGDVDPGNDEVDSDFEVLRTLDDVGPIAVISPPDTVIRGIRYPLQVEFENFGTANATFACRCSLIRPDGRIYIYNKNVNNLAPGATFVRQFANRVYNQAGVWQFVAWSMLAGDVNPFNDSIMYSFVSTSAEGWDVTDPVPTGQVVNKGGGITSDEDGTYYFLGGGNATDIYAYDDAADGPVVVTAVPTEDRKLGHGTQMAYLENSIYLLKGNRCDEFWQFDLGTSEWTRLPDVPAGNEDRSPKKGAALCVADGLVYLLKGNKTNEFFSFDPNTGSWTALASMPLGDRGKEVSGGGAMCFNGTRIFAFKGNRATEFYTYDIGSDVWQRLADIPTQRVKDGACLSYLNNTVFASVGGGKMEFWGYDVLTNTWTQHDEIPREPDNRRVKYGASMTVMDGMLLFIKGRKSEVVYYYQPPIEFHGSAPKQEGVMAEPATAPVEVTFAPNPAARVVSINCGASASRPVDVKLYNSSGQLVRTLTATRGDVELGVSDLVNGVYLLRVGSANSRLVVQH